VGTEIEPVTLATLMLELSPVKAVDSHRGKIKGHECKLNSDSLKN